MSERRKLEKKERIEDWPKGEPLFRSWKEEPQQTEKVQRSSETQNSFTRHTNYHALLIFKIISHYSK